MALFDSGSHTLPSGTVIETQHMTVEDRVRCVRTCEDPAQLREALREPGLQETVRKAILGKLGRMP